MPLVRRSFETLPFENMSQMTTTSGACDLRAGHAKSTIFVSSDGSRDGIEESGPTTTRIELRSALVERCSARSAAVNTFLIEFVVLARPWPLSSFLSNYLELLGR